MVLAELVSGQEAHLCSRESHSVSEPKTGLTATWLNVPHFGEEEAEVGPGRVSDILPSA